MPLTFSCIFTGIKIRILIRLHKPPTRECNEVGCTQRNKHNMAEVQQQVHNCMKIKSTRLWYLSMATAFARSLIKIGMLIES
jgi:hypothetical protein